MDRYDVLAVICICILSVGVAAFDWRMGLIVFGSLMLVVVILAANIHVTKNIAPSNKEKTS